MEGAVKEPKIVVDKVDKIFEKHVILKEFDLRIPPGQFLCIVGPSGCGKTTLINLLAGFDRPTRGEIRIDGSLVDMPGPERGIVFQQYALFPWLTVEQNVGFGLKMRGTSVTERRREVMKYLQLVGLEHYTEFFPKQLSGGMMQRAAIARAWIMQPTVLLMDEPFGALDAITRGELQQELLRWWQSQRQTVVFITHDIEEALILGERVIVMSSQPGSIQVDLSVDFSMNRTQELRLTNEFVGYHRKLWDALYHKTSS